MNKIHTINLGGHPYTVDEDAFEYLHAYIRSLRKHFKSSAGCEEIINDIESRLAELLNERMQDRSIVTLREVKEVIAIMGTPEEFGADPIDEKIIDPDRPKKHRSGKRLFRDPDDKIISGVCSGIAAYFGIQDPVWVRLVFGLMVFGAGIGLPLYIILRIIMPKADSAADRLAMKGEPIDYQSIAKKIQDEIEHLSSEFNNPLDPETKKHWNASMSTAGKGLETGANILSGIFHFIGNILQQVIPVLLKIAAVISIIFLCFFIVGLIFGWSVLWPYAPYFIAGIRPMSALAMMNVFFLGLIPLVFVIFLFARMYNGTRLPKSLAAGLGGLWVLNLMGGALFGINTARQFSNDEEISKSIYEGDIKADVLNIELGEKKERSDLFTLFGEAWIEDVGRGALRNPERGIVVLIFPAVILHFPRVADGRRNSGFSTSEVGVLSINGRTLSPLSAAVSSGQRATNWGDQKLGLEVGIGGGHAAVAFRFVRAFVHEFFGRGDFVFRQHFRGGMAGSGRWLVPCGQVFGRGVEFRGGDVRGSFVRSVFDFFGVHVVVVRSGLGRCHASDSRGPWTLDVHFWTAAGQTEYEGFM